jgi:hypothetical protein
VNLGGWVGVVGALVALISAVIAGAQARHAQSSARASARQARAAEVQADAAMKQVELAERQFDAEVGPKFRVEHAEWFFGAQRYVTVTVKMTEGPFLSSATATVSGVDVSGLVAKPEDLDLVPQLVVRDIGPDAPFQITAMVDWNASSPVRLVLSLECVAPEGRRWDRTLAVLAEQREDARLFHRRGPVSG